MVHQWYNHNLSKVPWCSLLVCLCARAELVCPGARVHRPGVPGGSSLTRRCVSSITEAFRAGSRAGPLPLSQFGVADMSLAGVEGKDVPRLPRLEHDVTLAEAFLWPVFFLSFLLSRGAMDAPIGFEWMRSYVPWRLSDVLIAKYAHLGAHRPREHLLLKCEDNLDCGSVGFLRVTK